jgi:hypothetical protein
MLINQVCIRNIRWEFNDYWGFIDFMNEDTGTKRLVSNVYKYMENELDCDIDELKEKIKDVVIKVSILKVD